LRVGNSSQASDQLRRFAFVEERRKRLIVLADDTFDLLQKLAAFGRG